MCQLIIYAYFRLMQIYPVTLMGRQRSRFWSTRGRICILFIYAIRGWWYSMLFFCFLMCEGVIVCASVCSIRCMRKQSLKFWRLILGSYTFSKCSIFRPVWGLFDKAGRVKRAYIQTCKVHCALWGCFWHKYVIVTSILCCCFSWQDFKVVAYVRIENHCDCFSKYSYLLLHSSNNIDEADKIVSAVVLGILYNKHLAEQKTSS